MELNEIRRIPITTSEFARMEGEVDPRIHESVFRSFHVVEKVKELCEKRVPHDVIIEIIDDLMNNTPTSHKDVCVEKEIK